LYAIYFLVLGGLVRAFLGPTIFSLHFLFQKVYPNAATWSSSVWQIGRGSAAAGLITLIGVIGHV
jgi:hypothetical protein